MPALWLVVLLAVAVTDLFTGNIHLAILYTLPLVLRGHDHPRRTPWPLVFVLVCLTYLGFFLGPAGLFDAGGGQTTLGFRLVNRTLTAITLLLVGFMQQIGVTATREFGDGSRGVTPREASLDDLIGIVDQVRGGAISLVIAFSIAAVDMLSPATFNLPILYVIPLLTSLRARSRPLLWGLTGVVLVLSGVGYLAGVPGEPAPFHNRLIAAVSVLLVASLGHRWMAPPQPHPARDPAPSTT